MIPLVRHQALLVVVALLMFFTNLGNYALFNDAESKNGATGAEMFRHGSIIVPSFNEELRTDQSILAYWFMLASFKLFGVTEFAARITSSLLAVGSTLLTYHLGRKLYSAEIGLLAGLILCTCLLFSAVGRSATPDSAIVFFVTLGFASYVWIVARQRGGNFSGEIIPAAETVGPPAGLNESNTENATSVSSTSNVMLRPLVPANWKFAVPIYIALGLAVLAKGPIGLLLPLTSIFLFLLMSLRERELVTERLKSPEGPWWRRGFLTVAQISRPIPIIDAVRGMNLLIGLGIVAAIILPWYLAIGVMTNGVWLREFLFDHNIGETLMANSGHGGFPFYQFYYVIWLLLGCFPWSVFLPVALYRMRQRFEDRERWRDSDLLLACWAGLWFLFFSLVNTRASNYVLPIYPVVALILARYFHEWERDEVDSGVYSFNFCCRAMQITGAVMIVGVMIAAYLLFSGDQWLAMIGAIPIVGGFGAMKFLDQEQRRRVMQCLTGSALLLAFLTVGIASERLGHYQDTPAFIDKAKSLAGGAAIDIGTYGYFRPSVVFYTGKKVWVLKTPREVADFLVEHPHAFVITKQSLHNELREELLDNVSELMRHRDFLHREELILLGRN